MKKKILIISSVILLFVLLFVWKGTSDSHNADKKQFEADIFRNIQNATVQEITQGAEKSEEKYAVVEKHAVEEKVQEEAEPIEDESKNSTCTLTVKCDTILNNLDKLDKQKTEIIPNNGIIYYSQNVHFFEGESVFNVLLREMKQNKIHFEFEITPIYDTAYIKGIANIYEFDCGELSGWIYRVNGQTPNVGCSLYYVSGGDDIEIMYTCNMGKDLERNYAA